MGNAIVKAPAGCLHKPEAAQYLGVSSRTIDNLMRARKLRVIRPSSRRVLFRIIDLDVYLSRTASMAKP